MNQELRMFNHHHFDHIGEENLRRYGDQKRVFVGGKKVRNAYISEP